MLNKIVLGVTALAASFTALPTAAEAGGGRYYDRGYYDRGYYDRGYYDRGYYDDGYYAPRRVYRQRHYNRYARPRYYDNGYHGRSYRDDRYYGRRRCGSGTTGAIIGGAGGALIGREIGRGGRGYYGRRGSGTGGAIIGGAVGALLGREIGRGC